MQRFRSAVFVACVLLAAPGCLAKQFTHDGIAIHKAAVNLYTEQAMANLIRARCNLPFVQLSYSKLSLTDKVSGKLSAETDQTVNTARELFVNDATRTLTNVYP